jgi:hypothetical protein
MTSEGQTPTMDDIDVLAKYIASGRETPPTARFRDGATRGHP